MVEVHALASTRALHRVRSDARSIADRVIGELFGWEFAQGVSAHERTSPAVLARLLPRYLSGDPCKFEFPELAPSPVVDACLGRLVAIARSEFEGAAEAHSRSSLHLLEVRTQVIARIHADPALLERARFLRNIASLAEKELELHYSERLLARLRAAAPASGEALGSSARMQRLLAHLSNFPYVGNYAHLVRAELSLLRAGVTPLYVRDRDLLRLSVREREELRQACARAASQLRTARLRGRAVPPRERSFVVCGCGPLPITGLMMHATTGAHVTLVDIDPHSAERAAALVGELERLRVLSPGAVRVMIGDAANPAPWAREHDVVLVASLVPQGAKLQLARALPTAIGTQSIALLFRSAAGLCAELAYEPVPTEQISSPALPFCGESVPEHLLAIGLTEADAAKRGVSVPTSREVIVFAHASVLNTTELYRSLPEHVESGV